MSTAEQILTTLQAIDQRLARLEKAREHEHRLAFTQGEAARLLGLGRHTLAEETVLGRIKRSWRGMYPRSEIERYLAAGLKRNEFMETRRAA